MALQTALHNLRNKKTTQGQCVPASSQNPDRLGLDKNEDEHRRGEVVLSSAAASRVTAMPPKYNSPAATVPMVSVGTLQRLKTFRFTKVQAPLNKACAEENEEQTSAPKRRAVCSDVTNATNAMATHLSPKPVRDAAVDLSLSPVASVSTPTDCHSHRDEHTMTVNRVVSSVTTMGEDRQTPEVVRAGVSRFKETIKGTSGGTSGVPSWVTIGVPSGGSSGVSSERTVRSLAGGMAGGTSGVVSSRGFEHETHTKEQLFDDFDMETFLADIDPDPLVPTDTPPSPSLPLSPAQQKAASGTSAAMVTFSSRTFPGNLGPASRHVQVAATQVPSKNVPPVPVAAPTGQSHPCVPREVALHPLPPLPSTGVATPGDPGVIQLEATLTPPCKSPTSMLMCRKFPGPAGVLQRQGPGQGIGSVPPLSPHLPYAASRVQRTPGVASFPTCLKHKLDPTRGEGEQMDFTKGPWVQMMEDLDMSDEHSSALLQFNVAALLKQASRRQLRNGKVTHLRVMLKSLRPASSKGNSAVLTDPTGEVLCALHHKVVEDHQKELTPGAVLVLRQVSVFSPAPRKHYLSITPDNIIRIYPVGNEDVGKRPLILQEVNKKQISLSGPRQGETGLGDNSTAGTSCQTNVESVASVFQSALCDDEFDQLIGNISEGLDF